MKNSLEQLHNRFEQVEEKKIMKLKIGQSRLSSLWSRKKKEWNKKLIELQRPVWHQMYQHKHNRSSRKKEEREKEAEQIFEEKSKTFPILIKKIKR